MGFYGTVNFQYIQTIGLIGVNTQCQVGVDIKTISAPIMPVTLTSSSTPTSSAS